MGSRASLDLAATIAARSLATQHPAGVRSRCRGSKVCQIRVSFDVVDYCLAFRGLKGSQMRLKLKQIGPRKMEVTSGMWSFVVDLKEKFGGGDSGPNPSELTAAAVASCEVLTGVVWAARRHSIELRDVEAEVTWEYEENPDRISRIDVTIQNVSSQLGEKTKAFAAIAKGCTVSRTFKTQPELSLKVE